MFSSKISLAQETTSTLRATELRLDKLGNATVLARLPQGIDLRILSKEGGWVLVNANGAEGWVRASALMLTDEPATSAQLPSGRQSLGNSVLTLGVREYQPRANRYALFIGISKYADPNIAPLPGVKSDRQSATQMALAMQIPKENIRYLIDDQATGMGIRKAIADLTAQVSEGGRVYVHYSGHGTRYKDPATGECVEALLAYEGGWSAMVTNKEMASLLKGISAKADKLFVMYDSCHSGGMVSLAPAIASRGLSMAPEASQLRPKFVNTSEECSKPVNIRSRSIVMEAGSKGVSQNDIVHLAAARNNELSFDDEEKGGLATQFLRDCMLRDAKDLDGSGAISLDEIRQCAQAKVAERMKDSPGFAAPNMTLSGNGSFVPRWFSAPVTKPAQIVQAPISASAPSLKIPELSGHQALKQIYDQRDDKRRVQVTTEKPQFTIGEDTLGFTVQSDRVGYLYVALAGSDNKSLYMLFPNDLDSKNRIEAGQQVLLPRPSWQMKSSGPPGRNSLLVMVADSPRDIATLENTVKAGPFVTSLNDAAGRARVGALLSVSKSGTLASCILANNHAMASECSDAFGAALVELVEKR